MGFWQKKGYNFFYHFAHIQSSIRGINIKLCMMVIGVDVFHRTNNIFIMADIFDYVINFIFAHFLPFFAQNPAEKAIFQKSEDITL